MGGFFATLQKVGQAFMLPVAVLPVAGILLGVGASDLPFIPHSVSLLMRTAGDSIFGIIPLIFAVATAIGFTRQDGSAALAAVVGFFVYTATLGSATTIFGGETKAILGFQSIETGVLGGILVGFVTSFLFNRYNDIKLPEYLAFFGGRRFVPIVTSLSCLVLGVGIAFIWQPIGNAIEAFSNWAAYQSPLTAFTLYAFVERSLIPTGLHHIWNVPFFFEIGSFYDPVSGNTVTGEIARYLAGDPTAGHLSGSYLFKMFGLPAAALAIVHSAKPEKRKLVSSIMISAAITSFLTGITEPIEFSFLFVAPLLYGLHICLAAAAYLVVLPLGIKHGTTFSHGLIDYLVLYSKSTKGWLIIPLGLAWAVLYYTVFRFAIQFFNLKTPGREVEVAVQSASAGETSQSLNTDSSADSMKSDDIGALLVDAYGGKENIKELDSCISRLRISVHDIDKVSKEKLTALGAKGVMKVGNSMQSIFGTKSDSLRSKMEEFISK